MSDHFTLMIIPNRKSGVKKISIPKTFIRNILIVSIVIIFVTLYVIYDYASIKRDRAELARLRAQTKEQAQQFQDLALRIDEFSSRMEELRQTDKKIRVLAYETSKDKKLPLGIGGSDHETKIKDLLDRDHDKLIAGMHKGIEKLNEDATNREKSFDELLAFLHEQKSILASTPSIWPVRGWVTSEFGIRQSPFSSGLEFHKGVDISTRFGKEVVAPADGLVVTSAYDSSDGNYVKIDHGHGLATGFAHLSRMAVRQGVRVKKGQIIGYVGDTGRSTGSHLHYAVFVNNIPVNPKKYLN
ncbi:MAG TPA: peptidoglycan DD-metalloendopeptidase family protein [Smithella sp.]|nr:peptidoglycan DD-metalloendopeptidase family protein [Smithella sp.]